jgi:UDP-N-acetylglucosamine 2-epimerase (non-hydrolysing)
MMSEIQSRVLTEFTDRVCVVLGTRPGTVMMAPVVRELERRNLPFFLLHSGQHYSYNMDRVFLEEFGLPEPVHRLDEVAGLGSHGEQTAAMLAGCDRVLREERPCLVLVGGDSNTNLAGALAARKLHIQVGHIEAGERSLDWRMPEEHNRVLIDHMAEYLFVTNSKGRENLERERVRGRIVETGNPIVDATEQHLAFAAAKSSVWERLGVDRERYAVMTLHREENVESEHALRGALEGMRLVCQAFDHRVVFPMHPRTEQQISGFELDGLLSSIDGLVAVPALGYMDFLALCANAALVFTDSGGVQQEACILRVPCVTLRETTEWTETVSQGANVLVGTRPDVILKGANQMIGTPRTWENPFGDAGAAERIADVVADVLDPATRWAGPQQPHEVMA